MQDNCAQLARVNTFVAQHQLPKHAEKCQTYVAALMAANDVLVQGGAAALRAPTEQVARQELADLLAMYTNEVRGVLRDASKVQTATNLRGTLRSLVGVLEGHAKTLLYKLARREHRLSMEALCAHGTLHLPVWDKALDALCAAVQQPRKNASSDVYAAFRRAAGMKRPRVDPDEFDLNDED
jgi:hypothetical protein